MNFNDIKVGVEDRRKPPCPYFSKIWQFYNVSENIIDQYDEINKHIDSCKHCQWRYNRLIENDLKNRSKTDNLHIEINCNVNKRTNPSWKKQIIMIAQLHKNKGNFNEVFHLCEYILNKDPDFAEAIRMILQSSYDSKSTYSLHDILNRLEKLNISKAMSLYFEGIMYYRLGHIHEAIIVLEESISLDPNNLFARNTLAIARLQNGNIKQAENEFNVLYIKFNELKDIKGITIVILNLADLQRRKGDFLKALYMYKSLILLFIKPETSEYLKPEKARMFVNLGELNLSLNERKKAKYWFKKCIEVSKSCFSIQNEIIANVKLGFIYLFENSYYKSKNCFNTAWELSDECNDELWKAESLRGKAVWHIFNSQFAKASECLQDTFYLYRSHKNLTGLSRSFQSQGLYYDTLHQKQKSVKSFEKSARLFRSKNNKKDFYETLLALIFTSLEKNNLSKAVNDLCTFLTTHDVNQLTSLINNYQSKKYDSLASISESEKLTEFIHSSLKILKEDIINSHQDTSFLKTKYLFISYFVSKYQQKFMFSNVNDIEWIKKHKKILSEKELLVEELNYLVVNNYDLTKTAIPDLKNEKNNYRR